MTSTQRGWRSVGETLGSFWKRIQWRLLRESQGQKLMSEVWTFLTLPSMSRPSCKPSQLWEIKLHNESFRVHFEFKIEVNVMVRIATWTPANCFLCLGPKMAKVMFDEFTTTSHLIIPLTPVFLKCNHASTFAEHTSRATVILTQKKSVIRLLTSCCCFFSMGLDFDFIFNIHIFWVFLFPPRLMARSVFLRSTNGLWFSIREKCYRWAYLVSILETVLHVPRSWHLPNSPPLPAPFVLDEMLADQKASLPTLRGVRPDLSYSFGYARDRSSSPNRVWTFKLVNAWSIGLDQHNYNIILLTLADTKL